LDKDKFVGEVLMQYELFEHIANNAYTLSTHANGAMATIRVNDYKFMLRKAGETFLKLYVASVRDVSEEMTVGRIIGDDAIAKMNKLINAVIKNVGTQIQKDQIRKSMNVLSTPVDSQLMMKAQDSVGRSYSASYTVKVITRQFAVLASLFGDYRLFTMHEIEKVDIKNSKGETIKTVLTADLLNEENIKLFHPNSNLKVVGHD
jgi:hypothetical protein